MKKLAFLLLVLFPTLTWACPFCDYGGRETALFIGSVFGILAVGIALFMFAVLKRSKFGDEKIANLVLEVDSNERK